MCAFPVINPTIMQGLPHDLTDHEVSPPLRFSHRFSPKVIQSIQLVQSDPRDRIRSSSKGQSSAGHLVWTFSESLPSMIGSDKWTSLLPGTASHITRTGKPLHHDKLAQPEGRWPYIRPSCAPSLTCRPHLVHPNIFIPSKLA